VNLFLSPHSDDEVLFGTFTLLRHKPKLVICCPSVRDYGDTALRCQESAAAMAVLGIAETEQLLEDCDVTAYLLALKRSERPDRVFAPHWRASHPDHRLISQRALEVFGGSVTQYHTYDARGKVRRDVRVPHEPGWIGLKLRALLCYQSQLAHPRACEFFAEDLYEYAEAL
jgi:LmbE family N-acetylglucosaminyl deacetylase